MKTLIFTLITLFAQVFFAQDVKRCENAEPPHINRMPGFYISECKNSDSNAAEFVYYKAGKANKINKGGKYYNIWYTKKTEENQKFSSAQIIQNYYNAVVKVKGTVLDDKQTMYTASVNGKEVYIQIHTAANSSDSKSYRIEMVEVESMQQQIKLDLQEAIDTEGKATLYGILFDIGKSDIKPESENALKQITDYLNKNPEVKIIVVGHTDNVGNYAANMTLSKARAESIKNYLITKAKIDVGRILSEGVGSVCPVSTNATPEGRTLNRRVEIVKQ